MWIRKTNERGSLLLMQATVESTHTVIRHSSLIPLT